MLVDCAMLPHAQSSIALYTRLDAEHLATFVVVVRGLGLCVDVHIEFIAQTIVCRLRPRQMPSTEVHLS